MFIAELIFAAAEILFLFYLVRKEGGVMKEMRKLRKNKILDEFKEKLYNYHHDKQGQRFTQ